MTWQNFGFSSCMDTVRYAQPTSSWLCTACGSQNLKHPRCINTSCRRPFHVAGVETNALGRAGKDKRRLEHGRRPGPSNEHGAAAAHGSGARRMGASTSRPATAPAKAPRALRAVTESGVGGCHLRAEVSPTNPPGAPRRNYASPHKRQRVSAPLCDGFEPLTVDEYAQGEPGYAAALAEATWARLDAWANTTERVVVQQWHLRRLFEFTTKVLVARRRDGTSAGVALLCEAPNHTDVCDTLHSHRNPSLPMIKTPRMTHFGPIRDMHVRKTFDKAVGSHPIDELVLICGERGVGVAVMAHLQGRQRLLFASVVSGSPRANRFYEKYFRPLPFAREDGEQPYVAWLGDTLLGATTARRMGHHPHPRAPASSSGESETHASDSDSQTS